MSEFPEKRTVATAEGRVCEVVEAYDITRNRMDYHVTHKIDVNHWASTSQEFAEDDGETVKGKALDLALAQIDQYCERAKA